MCPEKNSFPLIRDLWRGALLNTIAHAVWITADSLLAYEVGWDGKNYLRQDSMGASSAIHFADNNTVVGAFFSSKSIYQPFNKPDSAYSIEPFLSGIPEDLHILANAETLEYMLQEYDGIAQPIITAAFWSSGTNLIAAMSWKEVWTNGAYILDIELTPLESVFKTLAVNLDLSLDQIDLIQSLFRKRGMDRSSTIVLDEKEYRTLISQGNAGIAQAQELLSAINIQIPSKH
jgi:hypothetical protein